MKRYWFARSGDARYPHAMVPVTIEGRVLLYITIVALFAAWIGFFMTTGVIYHTNWLTRLPILAAGFLVLGGYAFLAFGPKGDRQHTERDYKEGRVPSHIGDHN